MNNESEFICTKIIKMQSHCITLYQDKISLLHCHVLRPSLNHPTLSTDSGSLAERKQVEALQEQAQMMLTEHVQLLHPRQVVRVGRLLLLPAKLHAIPSAIVERTFFRGLVGAASIPKLIGNILHSDIV